MSITYGYTSVERLLASLLVEEQRLNDWLLANLSPTGDAVIDEFALLVADTAQLQRLDAVLREMGWEHFNTATDNVRTAPIRSSYSVEYNFYRHPRFAWRLEVMRITSGVSPLHAAVPLPLDRGMATAVHASFKCRDETHYAVARDGLEDSRMSLAQQCDSNYGRFSYWIRMGDRASYVPYLKPRVNTRDA